MVVDGEYEIASWQTNDPRSPASTVLVSPGCSRLMVSVCCSVHYVADWLLVVRLSVCLSVCLSVSHHLKFIFFEVSMAVGLRQPRSLSVCLSASQPLS